MTRLPLVLQWPLCRANYTLLTSAISRRHVIMYTKQELSSRTSIDFDRLTKAPNNDAKRIWCLKKIIYNLDSRGWHRNRKNTITSNCKYYFLSRCPVKFLMGYPGIVCQSLSPSEIWHPPFLSSDWQKNESLFSHLIYPALVRPPACLLDLDTNTASLHQLSWYKCVNKHPRMCACSQPWN